MDWGRSKTILIFAFLILNLFLGYQLLQTRLENNTTYTDIDQTKYTLNQLIKINKIDVQSAIPEETPQLNDIVTKRAEVGVVTQKLPKPFRTNPTVATTRDLQSRLNGIVKHVSNYGLDASAKSNSSYLLYQQFQGRPLFTSTLHLAIKNGKVTRYTQSYYTVVDKGSKPEAVMSASRAFQFLIENYLQPYSEVTYIDLGYWGQSFGTEKQILSPSWRFVLSDGTTYFVDAIQGDVDVVEKES